MSAMPPRVSTDPRGPLVCAAVFRLCAVLWIRKAFRMPCRYSQSRRLKMKYRLVHTAAISRIAKG
ncbi:hypothetical protein GCM10010507_33100 [Streptomyces cinnamoneus]|uniref:Uncharacterized protein n=1 Tax=Streptomyces cinnamoneus TaxID=53446 RepID=A0A918TS50_STRCJ|nr:hypothetical protein GCM10010507_33100 [Streptomyces cinnamoneus]